MDMQFLKTPQSQPKQESKSWPHVPAEPGKFYGITDQHGVRICAMSHATWVELGTMIEKLTRLTKEQEAGLKRQHEAVFHLNQANKRLAGELAEITEKHKNLRKNYRKLKNAELSPMIEEPVAASVTPLFNPLG